MTESSTSESEDEPPQKVVTSKKRKSSDMRKADTVCQSIIKSSESRKKHRPESTSETLVNMVLARVKQDKTSKNRKNPRK